MVCIRDGCQVIIAPNVKEMVVAGNVRVQKGLGIILISDAGNLFIPTQAQVEIQAMAIAMILKGLVQITKNVKTVMEWEIVEGVMVWVIIIMLDMI
jgi:hypothetical protein